MTLIEKLSPHNFLSVCDVAFDIQEKLQMTNSDFVTIPVIRNPIRFKLFSPANTSKLMDNYGDARVSGITYLKNNNYILDYSLGGGEIDKWATEVLISVDRKEFEKFYNHLINVYNKTKQIYKKFSTEYQKSIASNNQETGDGLLRQKELIRIKQIAIIENKYIIEINNGTDDLSFRSKKQGEGLDKETKLFKIIFHLWDFRQEFNKKGSIKRKGAWITLDNLAIQTNSNTGAVYQNIRRLREKFNENKLPLEIESNKAGKYRLKIFFK